MMMEDDEPECSDEADDDEADDDSVLGVSPLVVQAHLDTARHGPGEALAQLLAGILAPHRLELVDEVGIVLHGSPGQLVLHYCPKIFNWVQVGGVAGPVNEVDVVGVEPVHGVPGGVARGTVLQETVATSLLVKMNEMPLETFHIIL